MFDRLVLLAKGKIIYFNKAELAVDYFEKIGYVCPELSNPCDYFMSMMSKESIELEHEEEGQVGPTGPKHKDIDKEYAQVIQYFNDTYAIHELKCDHEAVHPDCLPITGEEESNSAVTPWCYQYKLLATRNFLNVVRLPQTSYVKFLTTCVTASFVAFFFWQAGRYEPNR